MERRAEERARQVSSGDWKSEGFRRTLVGIVRKRVPERDVEDIVQATLTEALSPAAPAEEVALQRWLIGVARHKIADRYRRGGRESFEVPDVAADAAPHSARDLARWAERALPADGDEPHRTLEWMLREGDGEKLESIAESEQIPAPRVRKRVSRLRSHFRAQWKKEAALLAALGIVAVLVWVAHRKDEGPVVKDTIVPAPSEIAPSPAERARTVRENALAACEGRAWAACVEGLDRASGIDPAGDSDPRVVKARAAASAAINPPPPAPMPTEAPSTRPAPRSAPRSTSMPTPSLPPSGPSKTPARSTL